MNVIFFFLIDGIFFVIVTALDALITFLAFVAVNTILVIILLVVVVADG